MVKVLARTNLDKLKQAGIPAQWTAADEGHQPNFWNTVLLDAAPWRRSARFISV